MLPVRPATMVCIMRTPLDPRRAGVDLAVVSPADPPAADPAATAPYLPWLVASVVWSVAVLLLGWVAVGVLVAAAWLTALRTEASDVFAAIAEAMAALREDAGADPEEAPREEAREAHMRSAIRKAGKEGFEMVLERARQVFQEQRDILALQQNSRILREAKM